MTGDAPSVFGGRAGIHDRDVARLMLDMAKRAATRAANTVGCMDGGDVRRRIATPLHRKNKNYD